MGTFRKLAWFSCGVTSAVACKIACEKYQDLVDLVYIEIGSAHQDNARFIAQCEQWYGRKIKGISSQKHLDHFSVIEKSRFINSPYGARCTTVLKRYVRTEYEKEHSNVDTQIWGFEFSAKEINRAKRHSEANPHTQNEYPLIEQKLTKNNCLAILEDARIEIPAMYMLGYNNNNCIGCVKGGKGYWNKIRKDFPDIFQRMAQLEREIGRSCIKNTFLDCLSPLEGRNDEHMPECISSETCMAAIKKYAWGAK